MKWTNMADTEKYTYITADQGSQYLVDNLKNNKKFKKKFKVNKI